MVDINGCFIWGVGGFAFLQRHDGNSPQRRILSRKTDFPRGDDIIFGRDDYRCGFT